MSVIVPSGVDQAIKEQDLCRSPSTDGVAGTQGPLCESGPQFLTVRIAAKMDRLLGISWTRRYLTACEGGSLYAPQGVQ